MFSNRIIVTICWPMYRLQAILCKARGSGVSRQFPPKASWAVFGQLLSIMIKNVATQMLNTFMIDWTPGSILPVQSFPGHVRWLCVSRMDCREHLSSSMVMMVAFHPTRCPSDLNLSSDTWCASPWFSSLSTWARPTSRTRCPRGSSSGTQEALLVPKVIIETTMVLLLFEITSNTLFYSWPWIGGRPLRQPLWQHFPQRAYRYNF